ncbi:MAG: hypothetical protein KC445_20100, partial [Anaerolineales bacterium]|nr:hypothetical protein [Anaerolineales bacterium]
FELDIVYENLSGQSLDAKALSLVTYAQRHGLYDRLVAAVQAARPHLDFGAAPKASGGVATAEAPANPAQAGPTYNFYGPVTGSAIGESSVQAQNIAGGNITINYSEPKDKAEFADQLKQLEALLKQAIANGEIKDARDAETAVEDIQNAIEEVKHDEPRPSRITRYLEGAKEVIESASKTGVAVLKAVPVISGLIKVVSTIF